MTFSYSEIYLGDVLQDRGNPYKEIIETEKTNRHPGYRKDSSGLTTPKAEADALRVAAELREHVDGTKSYDGVVLWCDGRAYYFPVDWPPDKENEDGRFYWLWSDPHDHQEITLEEAAVKQRLDTCLYTGQIPRIRDLGHSAAASGKCTGSGTGDTYIITFIEFCCSRDSKASDSRYARPGVRFLRITEEEDPTTPEGIKQLLSVINDPKSGHVVVLSSIPCTLGCTWQIVNRSRKCMNDKATYKKYLKLQAKHKDRFNRLMTALELLADALIKVGGDLIHEWGAKNTLWNNPRVKKLIKKLDMQRAYFDGCALDLKEGTTGQYIRKPWVFSTSIPEIVEKFQYARCTCPKDTHVKCNGGRAVMSAFYTWKMTDWLHECINSRVESLYQVTVPSLVFPLEELVKSVKTAGWHHLEDSWFFLQDGATEPRKLSTSYSPKKWPYRSSFALKPSLGTNEWIRLEDGVDHTKVVVSFVHHPTRIVSVFHAPAVAMPSPTTETTRTVEEFCIASDDEDTGNGITEDQDARSENADSPWVVAWSINVDDEPRNLAKQEACPTYCVGNAPVRTDYPIVDVREDLKVIQAAAGAPAILEALCVANRWIIDTGCGKDLISYKHAMQFASFLREGEPYKFNTAGGDVTSTKILPINVAEFTDGADETHRGDAYVMRNSPNVLSVGLRCNHQGYSYIWLTGKTPCLILPSLTILPLDVIGDIPYLLADGLHTKRLDPEEITALTGVMIDNDGRLVLAPDFLGTYVEAAAVEGEEAVQEEPSSHSGSPPPKVPKGKSLKKKDEGTGDGTEGESTEAPPTGDDLTELDTDDEDAQAVSRSLKNRAASLRHRLNHKPALSEECDACMVGKTRAARKYKNRSERQPNTYGEIWTIDHVHMNDKQQPGIGGYDQFLTVKDRATGRKYAPPVRSMNAEDTFDELNHIRGDDEVDRIYCDNWKSFKKACKWLGVMRENSQPGVHETNAIVERANSDTLSGIRVTCVEAGHPVLMWPYSGPCFCMNDAICADDGVTTAYEAHIGEPFPGTAFPYGCGVFFKPAPTKYIPSKASPRMSYGVFLGYRLAPGGKWTGEYLVADLEDFAGRDFSELADPRKWGDLHPHVTKVVKIGHMGLTFPCKAKYDRVNYSLDGIEEAWDLFDPQRMDVNVETRDELRQDEVRGKAAEAVAQEEKEDLARVVDGPVPAESAGHGAEAAGSWLYGYAYDSIGRPYKLDLYGQRIRKGSRRPPYWKVADWARLSEKRKLEVAALEAAEKEKEAAVPPASPIPAAPAEQAAWDDKYDTLWSDINKGVDEFNESWDKQCDGEYEADVETDLPAAPAVKRSRLSQHQRRARRKIISHGADPNIPAMPCEQVRPKASHRPRHIHPLFPACVAEPVKRKDIAGIKEGDTFPAVEAMWKEANNLGKKKTWLLETVRPWRDVAYEARSRGETIHIGEVFGIMVIKNSELQVGDPKRKYKYRLVFSGDRVVNESWQRAMFQDQGSNPASMESGKTIDGFGSLPGHVVQQADAEQAYIQADLQGPTTWVLLPQELWPEEWWTWNADGTKSAKYDKPVVVLKKALYGHPDAGTYWEMHLNARLRKVGFVPIPSWPSCFWHKKLRLYLSVYVDDFKLAGPSLKAVEEGWELISQHVDMEKPTNLDLYLGCKHEQSAITLPNGKIVRTVTYNMEDYLDSTIRKYLDLASKLQGKQVVLHKVATPCIVEDQKMSPQGAPVSTGPCITCPWCKHAFPESAGNGASGQQAPLDPDPEGGVLQSIAASILMKVLYAARMARFDLLYAVNRLATYITKWTPTCDKRFHRIICYIHSTKHYRMINFCGDDAETVQPHVYADADLAGCAATQRSTTGIHAQLEGPLTRWSISGTSKRQSAVSSSTPEAEMVAGHHAFNKVIIPQMDLWQTLFGPASRAIFNEDNESMIQILRTGRNPTMKQLGRVHRVAIAVLHERMGNPLTRDSVDVVHTPSAEMAADIYTKAFTNPDSWTKALNNINVFDTTVPVADHIMARIAPKPEPEPVTGNGETVPSASISKKRAAPDSGGEGGASIVPPVQSKSKSRSKSKTRSRSAAAAGAAAVVKPEDKLPNNPPCLARGAPSLSSSSNEQVPVPMDTVINLLRLGHVKIETQTTGQDSNNANHDVLGLKSGPACCAEGYPGDLDDYTDCFVDDDDYASKLVTACSLNSTKHSGIMPSRKLVALPARVKELPNRLITRRARV